MTRRRSGLALIALVPALFAAACGAPQPSPSPGTTSRLVLAAVVGDRQQVFLAEVTTGKLTPLTHAPFADGVPVWSPDGSRVAFVRFGEDGSSELHVVRADGSGDLALTGGSGASDILPTWSPDGRRIAFVRVLGNGGQATDSEILAINADGSELRQLTNDPIGKPNDPMWSPDGSLIAFDAGDGERWLSVMNPSGGDGRRLTPPQVGLQIDWPLAWSPDSAEVAFTATSRAGQRDVFVVSRDGSLVDLTGDAGDEGAPAWSPDGRQLAFWSDRDGTGDLYVISRSEGDLRRLTTESHLSGMTTLAWSPDGTQLIVWRVPADSGASRNQVLSVAGGALRPLLVDPADEFMALWQP